MDFFKLQNFYKDKRSALYTFLAKRSFGSVGKGTIITPPFHCHHAKRIFLGKSVLINAYGWLDCWDSYKGNTYSPSITIGDACYIGHRVHICACYEMKIGDNVVLADKVFISDHVHGFEDISLPIMDQPLSGGPVTIEDEVWLGEGVCVLPNITIGKHSVVGSNSVVTKDIPAYSVAIGAPARIIKKYNPDTKQWNRV